MMKKEEKMTEKEKEKLTWTREISKVTRVTSTEVFIRFIDPQKKHAQEKRTNTKRSM